MGHGMTLRVSVVALIVAMTTGQACAESHRITIGPEVGIYLPEDAKTRDRFGSAWFSIGAKIGDNQYLGNRGRVGFDASILYQTRGQNHAFLMPLGVSYKHAIGPNSVTTPYVGASADLIVTDLRSVQDDIHSRTRGAYGGSVFAGVNLGRGAHLEARYNLISRVRGLDMSGLNLVAGISF